MKELFRGMRRLTAQSRRGGKGVDWQGIKKLGSSSLRNTISPVHHQEHLQNINSKPFFSPT